MALACRRFVALTRRACTLGRKIMESAILSGGVVSANVIATPLAPPFDLAPVFNDHMVLQRDQPVVIFGHGMQGHQIEVRIGQEVRSARVTSDGRFRILLSPLPAGGPIEVAVRDLEHSDPASATLLLRDVMVGDIWLSSGQSNMEWPLSEAEAGAKAIEEADDKNLRLFTMPRAVAENPADDLPQGSDRPRWTAARGQGGDGYREALGRFSAVAYYFGRQVHEQTGVPIGLITAAWGGTRIEPWTPRDGFRVPPPPPHPGEAHQDNPMQLFNGMIHPLVQLPIKGFLWYQGEANVGDGSAYGPKLAHLIQGWRAAFGGESRPFYFVQLAPYRYGWPAEFLAEVWEAQARVATTIRDTGIIGTADLGNLSDIHPRAKRPVGERLARLALARDYGRRDLEFAGPEVLSLAVEHGAVTATYAHVGPSGLQTRDGAAPTWFELAGRDGAFKPATASISGDSVTLRAPIDGPPRSIRFGFDQAAEVNLTNSDGLPAIAWRAAL